MSASILHLFFSWCDSLATDTEKVRQTLADYTDDLISLGVDGLRLDAAKRMSKVFTNQSLSNLLVGPDIKPDDIANILQRLETRPFITQEVRSSLPSPSMVYD